MNCDLQTAVSLPKKGIIPLQDNMLPDCLSVCMCVCVCGGIVLYWIGIVRVLFWEIRPFFPGGHFQMLFMSKGDMCISLHDRGLS